MGSDWTRRSRAAALTLAAVLAGTTACSFGPPDPDVAGAPPNLDAPATPTPSGGTGEQEVVISTLATGLDVPWGVAFLPDGGALVTERNTGRVLQVGPDSDPEGLKVNEVARLDEATDGLLGIAVSPAYETDKTIFVYYTTETDNRIAKMTFGGTPATILTGIPRSAADNGGWLAFGPDKFLYASTGDGTPTGTQAPAAKNLGGKILRMTTAGKPAPGNPAKDTLVWSSGHRNVSSFAWDATKKMFATETGQKVADELNIIVKGKNYGWPKADGKSGDAKLTDPLLTWPVAESGCTGVAALESLVATACLDGKTMKLISVTGNGTVLGQPRDLLKDQFGRLRTVVAAPDGSLWVTTSNQEPGADALPDDDRILRIVFSDGGAGRS